MIRGYRADRSQRSVLSLLELLGIDARLAEWMAAALCAQTDPEAFFPNTGENAQSAKSVCTECPVRAECLEYALVHNERFGVWGGLSERERRPLMRARRAAVVADPALCSWANDGQAA